jgi:hypothetical protein
LTTCSRLTIRAIRRAWKMGGERLDTWTALVRGGRVPEFGANLRY